MSILGKLFGGSRPSVNSVTFDVSGYLDQGEKNDGHVWFLPEGGGVALNFFRHPDLPEGLENLKKVKDFYSARLTEKQKVVDFRTLPLDGMTGTWMIIGQRRDGGHGMFYLGTLSILFRDYTFVIMVRCDEEGITGMRETTISLLANLDEKYAGRAFSPYDEEFDSKVPGHPLSRVRTELNRIVNSLHIDSKVKELPKFNLPIIES